MNTDIIICAFNAGPTIGRAVESTLLDENIARVVVIDDASSDETRVETIKHANGSSKIIVEALLSNSGPSRARNRGIALSESDWVGILDADDFFLAGRTSALLRYRSQADLVADDIWRVPENQLDGPRTSFLGRTDFEPRMISLEEFILSNVPDKKRPRGELGFLKPIMRRSFLEQHNLRYQEHMRLGEDYELYARALALGAKMLLVPAQGYVAVVRPDSLSGRHTIEDLRNLRDCDVELAKIPGLSNRELKALRKHYLSTDCRLQWRLLIEAVKARSVKTALATFLRPFPVPFYLVSQLTEQAVLRIRRKFFS